MDIVQKQNAAAFLLQPPHRAADDLARFDMLPGIGEDVRAPRRRRLRGKVTRDRSRAAKARNAKERGKRVRIAERVIDRLDAGLHLAFSLFRARTLGAIGMVLAVGAD